MTDISPELERGARAAYEYQNGVTRPHWDDCPLGMRRDWIEAFRRGISAALSEPSESVQSKAHAAGVRADLIWESVSEPLALRLRQHYVPAAIEAIRDHICRQLAEPAPTEREEGC